MAPSKEQREEFLRHYVRYQKASLEVNNCHRTLTKKVDALMVLTHQQTDEDQPTFQRERLELSEKSADAIDELAAAHRAMGDVLAQQAAALRMTAFVGKSILDQAEEQPKE